MPVKKRAKGDLVDVRVFPGLSPAWVATTVIKGYDNGSVDAKCHGQVTHFAREHVRARRKRFRTGKIRSRGIIGGWRLPT
jgi:hypothetical protein